MLITNSVEQKWNPKNKHYYIEKGYTFTAMKESFIISVYDLPRGSHVLVDVLCDYCKTKITKEWNRYISEHDGAIAKDCCNKCKRLKIVDVCREKYGVSSVFLLPDIKSKIENTNLERYGAKNPFSSDLIMTDIRHTNEQRYGHPSPMCNLDIQAKARKTCIEKYGVPTMLCNYIGWGENNANWKGGISYDRNERATVEYKKWRDGVFQRDSFSCQCCNNKSSKGNRVILNAHHLFNWKDNPTLRYEIETGVTLCENCHTKFHSLYSKTNNTPDQFKEFVKLYYDKKIC